MCKTLADIGARLRGEARDQVVAFACQSRAQLHQKFH